MHPSQIGVMHVKFRKKSSDINLDHLADVLSNLPTARYYSVQPSLMAVEIDLQGHLPSLVEKLLNIAQSLIFTYKIEELRVETTCHMVLFLIRFPLH